MKKLLTMIAITCSLGLIASSALAVSANAQNGQGVANGLQKNDQAASNVPQVQIDRVKKREEMNKRREELLKKRQQLIQSNSPGNISQLKNQ